MRLGVITSEFFEPGLGRMGGFGWAARQLADIFANDRSLGVELVYLAAELGATPETAEGLVHGSRLILRQPTRWGNVRKIRRERFDLLLTVDYNRAYSVYLRALPRTPAIVWVRAPRSPADDRTILSLRVPGENQRLPQGGLPLADTSLRSIAHESTWLGRKLLFASPAPHLVAKIEPTFGFEPWDFYCLPNPIRLDPQIVAKSERPSVVFLGRLDPIKRPWLFVELARRFPAADFLLLGQAHFTGPGAWQPRDLPDNVRLLGHVGEDEKLHRLSAAWVLVNTSIHEGLAISFLEALACQTPLLSCQDPGFTVSRHGIYTGRFDGSGMEGLDAFSEGLRALLENDALRQSLGKSGRAWVQATHTRERFIDAFFRLCKHAGVA